MHERHVPERPTDCSVLTSGSGSISERLPNVSGCVADSGFRGRSARAIACIALSLALIGPGSGHASRCPAADGVTLQVLGSGGPIADDARASSGYLVWLDGRARLLVDAGGGVFLRFGEAGARFADLDGIALSHLHTDHSAALPALLKSGYFARRNRPLPLAGPAGSDRFPGIEAFVAALFGDSGAYAYLDGYLDGSARLPALEVTQIDVDDPAAMHAIDLDNDGRLTLEALPVPHGIVPAVAYRVSLRGHTIVFAADQNGRNPAFTDFASGADVLVMHLAIPDDADRVARRLHATPQRIGEIARDVEPGRLLLSHFMARSLASLDAELASVRRSWDGPVELAEDLLCIDLAGR